MKDVLLKIAKGNPRFRQALITKLAKQSSYGFNEFWRKQYDNGKKIVRNPNPKGKLPKVTANTAMKDPSFKKRVLKEFKMWEEKKKKRKMSPDKLNEKKELSKKERLTQKKRRRKDIQDIKTDRTLSREKKREKADKGTKRKEYPGFKP